MYSVFHDAVLHGRTQGVVFRYRQVDRPPAVPGSVQVNIAPGMDAGEIPPQYIKDGKEGAFVDSMSFSFSGLGFILLNLSEDEDPQLLATLLPNLGLLMKLDNGSSQFGASITPGEEISYPLGDSSSFRQDTTEPYNWDGLQQSDLSQGTLVRSIQQGGVTFVFVDRMDPNIDWANRQVLKIADDVDIAGGTRHEIRSFGRLASTSGRLGGEGLRITIDGRDYGHGYTDQILSDVEIERSLETRALMTFELDLSMSDYSDNVVNHGSSIIASDIASGINLFTGFALQPKIHRNGGRVKLVVEATGDRLRLDEQRFTLTEGEQIARQPTLEGQLDFVLPILNRQGFALKALGSGEPSDFDMRFASYREGLEAMGIALRGVARFEPNKQIFLNPRDNLVPSEVTITEDMCYFDRVRLNIDRQNYRTKQIVLAGNVIRTQEFTGDGVTSVFTLGSEVLRFPPIKFFTEDAESEPEREDPAGDTGFRFVSLNGGFQGIGNYRSVFDLGTGANGIVLKGARIATISDGGNTYDINFEDIGHILPHNAWPDVEDEESTEGIITEFTIVNQTFRSLCAYILSPQPTINDVGRSFDVTPNFDYQGVTVNRATIARKWSRPGEVSLYFEPPFDADLCPILSSVGLTRTVEISGAGWLIQTIPQSLIASDLRLRRFRIRNVGGSSGRIDFLFYGRFNPSDINQWTNAIRINSNILSRLGIAVKIGDWVWKARMAPDIDGVTSNVIRSVPSSSPIDLGSNSRASGSYVIINRQDPRVNWDDLTSGQYEYILAANLPFYERRNTIHVLNVKAFLELTPPKIIFFMSSSSSSFTQEATNYTLLIQHVESEELWILTNSSINADGNLEYTLTSEEGARLNTALESSLRVHVMVVDDRLDAVDIPNLEYRDTATRLLRITELRRLTVEGEEVEVGENWKFGLARQQILASRTPNSGDSIVATIAGQWISEATSGQQPEVVNIVERQDILSPEAGDAEAQRLIEQHRYPTEELEAPLLFGLDLPTTVFEGRSVAVNQDFATKQGVINPEVDENWLITGLKFVTMGSATDLQVTLTLLRRGFERLFSSFWARTRRN